MPNIDRVQISAASIERSNPVSSKDQARPTQGSGTAPANDDSVVLSSLSREVDRYASVSGRAREERIELIRKSIEEDSYQVSTEDIARSMIESHLK